MTSYNSTVHSLISSQSSPLPPLWNLRSQLFLAPFILCFLGLHSWYRHNGSAAIFLLGQCLALQPRSNGSFVSSQSKCSVLEPNDSPFLQSRKHCPSSIDKPDEEEGSPYSASPNNLRTSRPVDKVGPRATFHKRPFSAPTPFHASLFGLLATRRALRQKRFGPSRRDRGLSSRATSLCLASCEALDLFRRSLLQVQDLGPYSVCTGWWERSLVPRGRSYPTLLLICTT